jgi:carboxymethylenebutenolidase
VRATSGKRGASALGRVESVEAHGQLGTDIRLTSADGHVFDAYLVEPRTAPRGALVIAQDAFGLGRYIRSVCDRYCAQGYVAIAPALYDRQQRGSVFDHSPESHKAAARFRAALNWDHVLSDVEAAIGYVKTGGRVGVLGFCVGGSVAWLTAASLPVAAAVCYYGKDIAGWLDRRPCCPTMLHFGESDHLIPLRDVELIKQDCPDIPVYVYAAGHGFDGTGRGHHAESAALARSRTLAFFRDHIG